MKDDGFAIYWTMVCTIAAMIVCTQSLHARLDEVDRLLERQGIAVVSS